MYSDVLMEVSAIKGDIKLIEDFSNIFAIRKITDDDRKKLSDLAVRFGKASDKHELALINTVEQTYSELAKGKEFTKTLQKILQDLFNAVTKMRYFITDAIKYLIFTVWSYIPKSIKDPINNIYTTYFEQHVLKLTNFFNNYVIVLFGLRMKLSEFIKNLFMIVSAGLIIHYIFFKAEGKVETPLEEDLNKKAVAYTYANSFIFIEGLRKLVDRDLLTEMLSASGNDIPERPKPKLPYGSEEPKTVYERIVEFFVEIGAEIRKTITTNIGKLIGLMIVVPLVIIVILGIKRLIKSLSDGPVKNFFDNTINSICGIMRIDVKEEAPRLR